MRTDLDRFVFLQLSQSADFWPVQYEAFVRRMFAGSFDDLPARRLSVSDFTT
jgi:hypothetical protein